MFRVYADGESIYNPLDESYILLVPKLVLEVGKAGSFSFQIPPSNRYYNSFRQLKTVVTVMLDDVEIFRGRVLTNQKTFSNIRNVYCEGVLAYLIDSVQKGERFEGKTHDLFRRIIEAHNARVEVEKQFTVGQITIDDVDVIIVGKSDDIQDSETEEFDYKQIEINSIADEWQKSFDYIESALLNYTGGYLRTRNQNGVNYIDLLADYGTTAVQEIQFGKNLLDFDNSDSPENIFTVLIPIGDENLTIESVNDGSEELVDEAGVARYGRILQTKVFDSVNDPNTLLENGLRYLERYANLPPTFTVKAIDMHFVDPDMTAISLGDKVHVNSRPHGVEDVMTCTKIEYDLDNPANNVYTFGTPDEPLTERYRKDKNKPNASGGGGGTGEAAAEEAKRKLDELFDAWINPDKEHGTLSLGALYKKYKEDKEILKSQVGIDLDAPDGQINIKAIKNSVDDLAKTVADQSSRIDLILDDHASKIELVTAFSQTISEKEDGHYAELTLKSDANESAILAHADRIDLIAGDVDYLNAGLSALVTRKTDAQGNPIWVEAENSVFATTDGVTSMLSSYVKSEILNGYETTTAAAKQYASITDALTSGLENTVKQNELDDLKEAISKQYATVSSVNSSLQLYAKSTDLNGYETKTAAATMYASINETAASIDARVSKLGDNTQSLVDIKSDLINLNSKLTTVGGALSADVFGVRNSLIAGGNLSVLGTLYIGDIAYTPQSITSTDGVAHTVIAS